MVTLAFHRCSSLVTIAAPTALAMPEYFSKLLMGFRLTTKADAACIVTLTQPEMKLHPLMLLVLEVPAKLFRAGGTQKLEEERNVC